MSTALDLRAGMAVAGLSVAGLALGGLAIGGAVALVTAPITPHLAIVRPVSGLAVLRGPVPAVEQAAFRATGQRDTLN